MLTRIVLLIQIIGIATHYNYIKIKKILFYSNINALNKWIILIKISNF